MSSLSLDRPGAFEQGSFWYLPMDVVHFGPGSLSHLPAELDRLGAHRALIITGRTISTRTNVIDRIRALLGDRLVGVFNGVRPHAPYESVQLAIDHAIESDPDLVISLGGGSAIDTTRGVALAMGEGFTSIAQLETLRATFEPPDHTTTPPTSGRALPHVAIPTTLSAAEFANAGALTSETRRVKDLFIADELTPRSVILDPEVALHTPVDLWVATGMRALDHAIETVYSPKHGPVTDVLSLESIGRLAEALRAARANPQDLAARAAGQMGAWLSYFGEMNLTLGLSHAIGHQLGAKHGVQHGVTSCIILPQAMRFLAPVTADRQALVARALGVDTAGMSPEQAAEAAAAAVEKLADDLGLPRHLADVGVDSSAFDELASAVMQDLVVAGSPIRITEPAQVISILQKAS